MSALYPMYRNVNPSSLQQCNSNSPIPTRQTCQDDKELFLKNAMSELIHVVSKYCERQSSNEFWKTTIKPILQGLATGTGVGFAVGTAVGQAASGTQYGSFAGFCLGMAVALVKNHKDNQAGREEIKSVVKKMEAIVQQDRTCAYAEPVEHYKTKENSEQSSLMETWKHRREIISSLQKALAYNIIPDEDIQANMQAEIAKWEAQVLEDFDRELRILNARLDKDEITPQQHGELIKILSNSL